jgi:kinesin family member 5
MLTCDRFEQQLQAVKERLEATKLSRANGAAAMGMNGGMLPQQSSGAGWMASAGARIAKPLRGGGGAAPGGVEQINGSIPAISALSSSDANGKRSSWFFNTKSS